MLILRKRVIDLDASADFCISTGEKTQGGEKRMRLGKEEELSDLDLITHLQNAADIDEREMGFVFTLLRSAAKRIEQIDALRAELKRAQEKWRARNILLLATAEYPLNDINPDALDGLVAVREKLAAAESSAEQAESKAKEAIPHLEELKYAYDSMGCEENLPGNIQGLQLRTAKLERLLAMARKIIINQPHARLCNCNFAVAVCDCWKAAALKELEKQ
jgi:hypothetical protein